MNAAGSPQSTPPAPAPAPLQVTGLPIDVVAVLAALQDQIDELTAHVTAQAAEIRRLSRLVERSAPAAAHDAVADPTVAGPTVAGRPGHGTPHA